MFPGSQGGPLEHVIAAKAVAFHEAAQPEFKDYAAQIVRNARGAGRGAGRRGLPPRVGRHRQPPDARRPAHASTPSSPARRPRQSLDRAGITLNKNTIPDDPRPPFVTSGLRIGTPAVTTQGMSEPEMAQIAELIAPRAVATGTTRPSSAAVRGEVDALCSKFVPYPG